MLRRIAGFVAAFVLASAVTGIVGGIAEAAKGNRAETNTVVSSNMSDGTAQQVTGAASATGNISGTTLGQGIAPPGGGGFGNIAILDNNSRVTNRGVARAVTGNNTGTGNNSTNVTGSFQFDTDGGSVVLIPILGLGPGGP
jgi:hypothetical protein